MVKTLIPEQGSYLFGTRKQLSILFFLTTVCVVAFFLAILNGSYQISLTEIFSAEQESIQKVIINDIRLPRVLLSLLVGASLGMCGAVLQGLFRNPLADPGLIGVSAGAALGAVTEAIVGLLSNATLRLSRPNAVMIRLLTPILILPWALVVDTLTA